MNSSVIIKNNKNFVDIGKAFDNFPKNEIQNPAGNFLQIQWTKFAIISALMLLVNREFHFLQFTFADFFRFFSLVQFVASNCNDQTSAFEPFLKIFCPILL